METPDLCLCDTLKRKKQKGNKIKKTKQTVGVRGGQQSNIVCLMTHVDRKAGEPFSEPFGEDKRSHCRDQGRNSERGKKC